MSAVSPLARLIRALGGAKSRSYAIHKSQPFHATGGASALEIAEQTPAEYISRHMDQAARLKGLPGYGLRNSSAGDAEIRVWYGFGLSPLQGFLIKRANNQWSASHLKADNYSDPKRIAKIQLPSTKSGWESCWQRLVNLVSLLCPAQNVEPDPDIERFYMPNNSLDASGGACFAR